MNALRLSYFSVVVAGVVGCGLLNGLTEGDVRSPFAEARDLPAGSPCTNVGQCRFGLGFTCPYKPEGSVCACAVGDECPTDEACKSLCPSCVAADQETCSLESVLEPSPYLTEECTPTRVTASRDGDEVEVDVFIPPNWISGAPERLVVILLHNDGGSPNDWRAPGLDLPCALFNRDISVWSPRREPGVTPASYLEIVMLGMQETFAGVTPAQISIVAGSAAVGELHELIVDGTSLRSAAFLSGGGDFAPAPTDVASAVSRYPEDALWMAAADDGACGTPSCIDYLNQMRAAVDGERSWTFHQLVGADHGAALISNGAVDVEGNAASSILLQMLEP